MKHLLPLLAVLATLQGSSLAADELVMCDQEHVISGEVISSTANTVTFKHMVGDLSDTQTYDVMCIDPHTFYRIRAKAVGNDVKAKVELGRFAATNGLFTMARNQYIQAQKLDKSLDLTAELAAAKLGSAQQLLAKARASAEAGKSAEAFRATASIIRRFPNTAVVDEARQLNMRVHEQIVSGREAKMVESEAMHKDKDISRVQREIHKASDDYSKALQAKSGAETRRGFEKSIKGYGAALKQLNKLAEKHMGTKDAEGKMAMAESEITTILNETKASLIDVHVSLGTIYLADTNYQAAIKEANAAIAVDPKSTAAKSLRARIATVSAESGGVSIYGGSAIRARLGR